MKMKEAERILMRNLKGSRIKAVDTVTLAEAVKRVKIDMTVSDMVDLFNVSHTMLQRLNKINQLSDETKNIVKRLGFGIEQTYLLTRIPAKIEEKAARAMGGMSSHEARKFINMVRNSGKSVEECKKEFNAQQKNFSLLVIPLHNDTYQLLSKQAKKSNKQIHDHALDILEKHANG